MTKFCSLQTTRRSVGYIPSAAVVNSGFYYVAQEEANRLRAEAVSLGISLTTMNRSIKDMYSLGREVDAKVRRIKMQN